MQIPTGVLVDTLGPRRVLTAGGVVAGVGSILFGLADSLLCRCRGAHAGGSGRFGGVCGAAQDQRELVRRAPFRDR